MTLKYFGEYLVSKGIITEEILVNALVKQTQGLPTILDIIHKKRLLDSPIILKVMKFQSENRVDFKYACQKLSVWDPHFEKEVENEIHSVKTPLGQILIKMGASDLNIITRAMDDFLSNIEAPPSPSGTIPDSSKLPKKNQLSLLPSEFDQVGRYEIISYFSVGKIESIKKLFSEISQSNIGQEEVLTLLKLISIEVHTIRGIVDYFQITPFKNILIAFENFILNLISNLSKGINLSLLSLLSKFGEKLFGLFESFKDDLVKGSIVLDWLNNPVIQEKFDDLEKKIKDAL